MSEFACHTVAWGLENFVAVKYGCLHDLDLVREKLFDSHDVASSWCRKEYVQAARLMPYHRILPRPVPRPVPLLMNAFSEALVAAFTVLGRRDMQKSGMPLEGQSWRSLMGRVTSIPT